MKKCNVCGCIVDEKSECPICGNTLTYEPPCMEEKEKLQKMLTPEEYAEVMQAEEIDEEKVFFHFKLADILKDFFD